MAGKKYQVLMLDNFHFGDIEEEYVGGEFDRYEDAVLFSRKQIDDEYTHFLQGSTAPDKLYEAWVGFGETPLIIGELPAGMKKFNSTDYARMRQSQIIDALNVGLPSPEEIKYYGWDGRDHPKKMSRDAEYIATVEWAWSPWSSRQDSYHLHRGRTDWLLWGSSPNENGEEGHGRYIRAILAACPRRDIEAKEAARLLLTYAWKCERDEFSLDAFHFLGNDGLLSGDQIDSIAEQVWPDGKAPPSLTPFTDAARLIAEKKMNLNKKGNK
jgi:hypothetical protein